MTRTTPLAMAAAFAGALVISSSCGDRVPTLAAPSDSLVTVTSLDGALRTNQPPLAWIDTPDNASTFTRGTSVRFSGGGFDAEDGTLTGASLIWSSDRDGQLGTGTSISSSNLSAGVHTITLTARDSKGATYQHNRTLTITGTANQSPSATISSPGSNANFSQGASVSFAGSGSDPEDGALSGASLAWTSSRDGAIGTGATFTSTHLSVGAHTITLTAKDSKGATGIATRSITVAAAPSVASVSVSLGVGSILATNPIKSTTSATVTLRDATGNILSSTGRTIAWSSSNTGRATVSSTGVVTGVAAGVASISATVEGVTAAATITVISPPVISITVSVPRSLTIGATATATATTLDLLGNALTGRIVAWTSNAPAVATVNSSGIVTAVSAGTATITATSEGTSASSVVTVAAGATGGTGGATNEPAGLSLIAERPFNCAKPTTCESNWIYEGGANSLVIASVPTAPHSAPNVGQMNFPAGFAGAVAPANAEFDFPSGVKPQTFYMSTWTLFSPNWQGHPTNVNKMIHIWINGLNRVFTEAWGKDNGTLQPAIGLQGLAAAYNNPSRNETATSVDLLPNVNAHNIVRGQWAHFEYLFVANTPGVANGSLKVWVDGVQTHNYTGIMYTAAGGSSAFSVIKWNPTWGGGGGVVSSAMFMQMDDIYMSGK